MLRNPRIWGKEIAAEGSNSVGKDDGRFADA